MPLSWTNQSDWEFEQELNILYVALTRSTDAITILTDDPKTEFYATPLTLAQCANTLLWTIYGVMAAKDIFVYGPNGVGLSLGIAQLFLKLLFPSKAKGGSA